MAGGVTVLLLLLLLLLRSAGWVLQLETLQIERLQAVGSQM